MPIVRGRVGQDAGLKHLVSSLAGSYVAEASPTDRLHGIGMPADDPNALCPTLWQGANVLGWAYMTVSQEMAGYKRRDSSNADGASECYHCDGGWFEGGPCWFCQEGLLEDDEEEEEEEEVGLAVVEAMAREARYGVSSRWICQLTMGPVLACTCRQRQQKRQNNRQPSCRWWIC